MASDPKISVCHIASGDLWAGAEVQMFTLLEALSKDQSLSLSAILLNHGKLADKLHSIGLDLLVLDEKKTSFHGLRQAIIGKLSQSKTDLIHSHRYKENILAGSIKKRCHIKALIQTVHGIGEPHKGLASLKSRIYDTANRICTRNYFDKIITVSTDIQNRLEQNYSSGKLITIHNAVDTERIRPSKSSAEIRREFNIAGDTPIIGAIGRMVPVKSYDTFLLMAKEILKSHPDTQFMLVGDGPLTDELQRSASDMGVAKSVIFAGFRDDVLDIMNAFDIFVISSLHEGIPMALLEAMALRKAVVSTAVGGINEVLVDNVSGLLVKSREPAALAAACLRVLSDQSLRDRLASGASRRINEEFSIDILKARIINLYKEVAVKT